MLNRAKDNPSFHGKKITNKNPVKFLERERGEGVIQPNIQGRPHQKEHDQTLSRLVEHHLLISPG